MQSANRSESPTQWLLAIESSGLSCSACIGSHGQVHVSRPPEAEVRSASWLAPSIQSLLTEAKLVPSQLAAIAVTNGPGSFTGLRVGIATTKTMAYALNIPTIGIDSLHAIAWQVQQRMTSSTTDASGPTRPFFFWTILDAFRGELFVARWSLSETGQLERHTPTHVTPLKDWIQAIRSDGKEPLDAVFGPGISRCEKEIEAHLVPCPKNVHQPQSESVFALAWHELQQGHVTNCDDLKPVYYRQSAAQEKAALAKGSS
jgi:tRNA threonylcarbamoyladenosine biosynthesis protein TsaB